MFTYVIKSYGLYKIGKTKDMDSRMFTYCLHNPSFEVIGYLSSDVEKYLHEFFSEYHVHREWYKIPKKYITELIKEAKKQNNWSEYKVNTIKLRLSNLLALK